MQCRRQTPDTPASVTLTYIITHKAPDHDFKHFLDRFRSNLNLKSMDDKVLCSSLLLHVFDRSWTNPGLSAHSPTLPLASLPAEKPVKTNHRQIHLQQHDASFVCLTQACFHHRIKTTRNLIMSLYLTIQLIAQFFVYISQFWVWTVRLKFAITVFIFLFHGGNQLPYIYGRFDVTMC